MAALYEGYTLCGLVPTQNPPESGIQGIELDRDDDRVLVTDSTRSVTVYKVSDQKPLGSWTVKQGQFISCPAVYNSQTKEYVAVTNDNVIRVWKTEDVNIDQAFKATVSAEIYRVHSVPDYEPVVLFRRGGVRYLDSLLTAPQQPIEEVLLEDEVIRWSTMVRTEQQLLVLFSSEQRGKHFLYVQRFSPNTLVKHQLEAGPHLSAPLSYAATFREEHIHLLYWFPNGSVYESVLPARHPAPAAAEEVQALPRSLLLQLPIGEGELRSASALPLDEAHVAVVGVSHPSAGTGKDYLCLWNTHFQTLQASRELAGKIYGQVWCYYGKLFVTHGKTLSVIPFECQKSSLAAALGKLKQTRTNESKGPALVPSWNTLPHGDKPGKSRGVTTRRTKLSSKHQITTIEQLTCTIQQGPVEEVEQKVEMFLIGAEQAEQQLAVGRLVCELVARCRAEPSFYPRVSLLQLADTRYLCHSVCPGLLTLALEKKDFRLCQVCLQLFPDIPEAITCACLKVILGIPDAELECVALEPDSLHLMKALTQGPVPSNDDGGEHNGFCPAPLEEDGGGSTAPDAKVTPAPLDTSDRGTKPCKDLPAIYMDCPVGLHKGALLNEVLQTAYSDSLLLPYLKDLTVTQVILFLQYLQFLYLKYSQDVLPQIQALRMPAVTQIMEWVCLLLDAHFTVLVLAPEAKHLLSGLHKFVKSQVKLFSELGKIEGSLQVLKNSKQSHQTGQYSIEVVELF
ncbi:nucleolar protein 11-like isoform X1 [Electrophorus electricus]|uniref:Nucleolar protein 11 n=1 Tax=Electrophorus electricus TaxID=8005 RepID=A0A4W4EGD0_ELEEL|nr:nucleolar protein 11-like isoform X1 [Electrophorus electricus]